MASLNKKSSLMNQDNRENLIKRINNEIFENTISAFESH